MAQSKTDRQKLSVCHLDDRILPSSSPAMLIPPIPWTESHFFPSASSPAENGGLWVIGTTQAEGAYGWWGPFSNDWGLVKLKADNTIDPSFNGGKVKDLNANMLDWFRIQQIQTGSDGKVYVLARNIARDPVIATGQPLPHPVTLADFAGKPAQTASRQLTSPAASQPAASTNAELSTAIWPSPIPNPIHAPEEDFAIVRLNADGTLDRSFNNDGIALLNLRSADRSAWGSGGYDVKFDLNSKGQIAVAATQWYSFPNSLSTTFDVVRLTPNGNFDTAFDNDGKVQIAVPALRQGASNDGNVLGIQMAENGGITIGGISSSWVTIQPAGSMPLSTRDTVLFVAKLTEAGSMDASFNGDGIAMIPETAFGKTQGITANDFIVTSDGSSLFAGSTSPPPYDGPQPIPPSFDYPRNRAFIAKLTPGGLLDTGFDGDGILEPDYGHNQNATSAIRIVSLDNGDFVLASQEVSDALPDVNSQTNYAIARHNADGSIDPQMAIVRETPANASWITDLDALTDGRISAISGYPQKLIVIDPDGVPATHVTIPYSRTAPWFPPPGWRPFPNFPGEPDNHRETLADVNGDGMEDRIYVSGQGNRSSIRIVNGANGQDLVTDDQPYEDRFIGGMFVDAGDFDNDGRAEIVVSPDIGGSARIQIFTYEVSGLRQRANFFAIEDPNFRGGGSIGVIDINEDGTPDVVVGAARGGSQRIANFDGKGIFMRNRPQPTKLFGDYFAPLPGLDPMDYRDGVELFTTDIDGNGTRELTIRPTGMNGPGTATVLYTDPAILQFNVPGLLSPSLFDPLMGIFVD
jgi:uncharacterized delta-60 repeat protein